MQRIKRPTVNPGRPLSYSWHTSVLVYGIGYIVITDICALTAYWIFSEFLPAGMSRWMGNRALLVSGTGWVGVPILWAAFQFFAEPRQRWQFSLQSGKRQLPWLFVIGLVSGSVSGVVQIGGTFLPSGTFLAVLILAVFGPVMVAWWIISRNSIRHDPDFDDEMLSAEHEDTRRGN